MKFFKYLIISISIILTNFGLISNTGRLRVSIDNQYIQTYKNTIGKWVLYDKKNLNYYATEYETTVEEILRINNHNLKSKKYIFVPFGEKYKNDLLKKGYGRRILEIEPNKLLWPLENLMLTSRYGRRFHRDHTGIDFAAPVGTIVVSADMGTVKQVGWIGGYGLSILIQHPDGKETLYAHLSEIFISVEDEVQMGQIIGLTGTTGISTGPHLHFEVRYQNIPFDPEDFFPSGYFRNDVILREGEDGIVIFNNTPDRIKQMPFL